MAKKRDSRQVVWQRKKLAEGRCVICGEATWREGAWRCARHHEMELNRHRRRRQAIREAAG